MAEATAVKKRRHKKTDAQRDGTRETEENTENRCASPIRADKEDQHGRDTTPALPHARQPRDTGRGSMVEEAEWMIQNRHPRRGALPRPGEVAADQTGKFPTGEISACGQSASRWQRIWHRIRRKQDP